jgi:hypothetical protein
MTHPATHIFTLALAAALWSIPAGAQALPNKSAATHPATSLMFYVQTTSKLTLVSGSLFKNTAGLRIGTVSHPHWSNSYE